ncbi:MAG TPA: hypothetical protein PKH79_12720 [Prolixibacteraceae bacterium]|nr:hypothetical protein [Prolixibacteraceae bacterium]
MNLPKWMFIFNSFVRLQFYAFLETHRPEAIADLDKHFQYFVDTNGYNPQKTDTVRFFGGDMLIGLSYLILVRTFEYVNKDLSNNEKLDVLKIENWNIFKVTTFDNLINRYSITVNLLADQRKNKLYYSNDAEKLDFFVRKIRNSIGHHRYTYPDMDSIKLIDINNGIVEMECVFKYSNFLNFCMDYFHIVNTKLYSIHHQNV